MSHNLAISKLPNHPFKQLPVFGSAPDKISHFS